MDIGMLWYDGDPKQTLDAKVASAVEYYKTKYGVAPTVCFVHPSMLAAVADPSTSLRVDAKAGVQLRPARVVMVNHFWLGLGDNTASPEPRNGARSTKGRRLDT